MISLSEMGIITLICLLLFLPTVITVILIVVRSRKKSTRDLTTQESNAGKIKCPYCAEWIQPDAKICRFCGRSLPTIIDMDENK